MIIRADHTDGYFCMVNSAARDTRLSCEACGLLTRMLSCSDDWSFSAEGLATLFNMSIKTVRRLVKELRDAGYIKIEQKRNEHGFFTAVEWLVYEVPDRIPLSGVTADGVPVNGITVSGVAVDGFPADGVSAKGQHKKYQYKEVPNKEVPSKEVQKNKRAFGEFQNVFLSDSEFANLRLRFGDYERGERIEDLSRYLAQHPKKKYASHYATILAWARKDQRDIDARISAGPVNNVTSIPHTEDGIDWDRIARMAEEQFNSMHGGTNT